MSRWDNRTHTVNADRRHTDSGVILHVVQLNALACGAMPAHGADVDMQRNLANSVTVT